MPFPLVILGWSAVSAAAASLAAPAVKSLITHELRRHHKDIEQWAMQNALEAMGLPIDLETQDFTPQTFTAAINQGLLAGTGVEFTNIFDKYRVKEDLRRIALQRAALAFGVEVKTPTVEGIGEAIRGWLVEQMGSQLEAGSGDLIEAAADLAKVLAVIRAYQKRKQEQPVTTPGGGKPLLMTPQAISNRERQARYRASHKKIWVPK